MTNILTDLNFNFQPLIDPNIKATQFLDLLSPDGGKTPANFLQAKSELEHIGIKVLRRVSTSSNMNRIVISKPSDADTRFDKMLRREGMPNTVWQLDENECLYLHNIPEGMFIEKKEEQIYLDYKKHI